MRGSDFQSTLRCLLPVKCMQLTWGLQGQPFLTQEMVTVSFENEQKKCVFGYVPDGFVVFIVTAFCLSVFGLSNALFCKGF